MACFKSKFEYLKFEQECGSFMNKEAKAFNRRKYNITESDLEDFYGFKYKRKSVKKKKKFDEEPDFVYFNKNEVAEQLHLFQEIFDDKDECFVRIRNRSTGEYYSYPVAALLDETKLYRILNSKFSDNNDLMYSLNTYNNMQYHSQNNIFTLNSFAIDLDFKEVKRLSKKTPKQIINMLEKSEFNKSVPAPNIIEFSNNIRLIYVLEKSYATKNVNTLVNRICKTIGERLSDYGAKGQPITTFARVVNSVNSKVDKPVKVTYLDINKYNISYLKDTVLPPLPEWYSEYKLKTKRKATRVIDLSVDFKARGKATQYNLNRIQDFFKIVDYFDGDIDGRRFLCFQVRNHCKLAGMSDDEAKEVLKEFNNKFKYPLRWNVIEQDTRNVNRKQYYYKSQYILDFLCIEPEVEEILHLDAILSKVEYMRRENIRVKAYQKAKYRNEEGLTKTEVKRRNEFIIIARLQLQGFSIRAIAKELGKDRKTISEKINNVYKKVNYNEILQEVKLGYYDDLEVAVG